MGHSASLRGKPQRARPLSLGPSGVPGRDRARRLSEPRRLRPRGWEGGPSPGTAIAVSRRHMQKAIGGVLGPENTPNRQRAAPGGPSGPCSAKVWPCGWVSMPLRHPDPRHAAVSGESPFLDRMITITRAFEPGPSIPAPEPSLAKLPGWHGPAPRPRGEDGLSLQDLGTRESHTGRRRGLLTEPPPAPVPCHPTLPLRGQHHGSA